ncbi:MAG TPA: DUF4136 domain-containing protein [Longimicrobiales bacterium]|nr:DUF4136 domain-containing protein [Longimicrobiales bacterium]
MSATTRLGLALALAALAGGACGGIPLRAGADFEPGYDFRQYGSYTWDQPDERPTGDPRLDNNPFFVHRLHAAIHWELATRGIQYGSSSDGPALTVHHHASVRDRVDVYEADREAGYDSEYGEGTQVVQYEEATFLVDIADARTGEIVWRGWAMMDVGRAISDPAAMREQIDEAIRRMFESFPIPPGSTAPVDGR